MKKLFTIAALALATVAFSQTEKGTLFVGGSAGFSSQSGSNESGGTTVDDPKVVSGNFMPRVGYFVADDLAVGVRVGYSSTKTDDKANDTKNSSSSFGAGVFAKKYVSLGDRFFIFGMADIGFGSSKSKIESGNTTTESDPTKTFGINISPGVEFFPCSQIGISASFGQLGFNSESTSGDFGGTDYKDKSSSFDLNLNSNTLNFGFHWYFGQGE